VLGAISPHAGYQFSGPGAAWVFKQIAETQKPDVYIMLGLSHQGFPSCISLADWKTPLGILKNESSFGKLLSKNAGLPVNEEFHKTEHSIEVQLPFLQFVQPEAKICPVMLSHDTNPEKVGNLIIKTANEIKKSIIIIASSDFTHYGPAYGYTPFSKDIKKNIYSLDKGAIDKIKALDSGKFLGYVEEKQATICGQMPIAAIISAMKAEKAKKAELLRYYTSGDVIGDYSNAVGYASIIFK